MKKNLLAVAVVLGLWHSAILANQLTDMLPAKVSPTIDESSYQPFASALSPAGTDPFTLTSEGAYLVASECLTFVDPVFGFAEEICW